VALTVRGEREIAGVAKKGSDFLQGEGPRVVEFSGRPDRPFAVDQEFARRGPPGYRQEPLVVGRVEPLIEGARFGVGDLAGEDFVERFGLFSRGLAPGRLTFGLTVIAAVASRAAARQAVSIGFFSWFVLPVCRIINRTPFPIKVHRRGLPSPAIPRGLAHHRDILREPAVRWMG